MTDIVDRLRKVEPDEPGERTRWYRNPDGPEAAATIEALRAEVERLRELWADVTSVVAQQAEDEGLWFVAKFISEAHLQLELRRLHGVIERRAALTATDMVDNRS